MLEYFGINAFNSIGLKAENLKCFGDAQGFDVIKPFNVIIGKNNVGKSTLIDMIQYAVKPELRGEASGHMGRQPLAYTEYFIDQNFIDKQTNPNMWFSNRITFKDWVGNFCRGRTIKVDVFGCGEDKFIDLLTEDLRQHNANNGLTSRDYVSKVYMDTAGRVKNPFAKHTFRRIVADRDIRAEMLGARQDALPELEPNGDNATRLLTRYLQQDDLDRSIIEKRIVGELNEIFRPDANFKRLVPRQRKNGEWEIYLEEPSKGLIPMSRTGSGIKTVLLVLMNLYLVPDVLAQQNKATALSACLFGFEELENNLHPSLQRRLFLYLRRLAEQEHCKFFVTTHSHVVIDLFSQDEQAQIIHVTHDGTSAKAEKVTSYLGHKNIFDDLEVRASDLLQTNAVVWVEGPSDRVYFNKWVELWTNGRLKQHIDYEVCFTAGTLLAHYSFDNPQEENERIQALKINRNAIILIDSDKANGDDDKLKHRAERVAMEVKLMGGIAWVTSGKEVENYIPDCVFALLLKTDGLKPKNKHSNVFNFIKGNKGGDYTGRKTELAERVCEHLTQEMIESHLDLKEWLDKICSQINTWNDRRQID